MKPKLLLTPHEVDNLIIAITIGTNTSDELERLISHFHSTKDIGQLSLLLDSEDENVADIGIYILAEIGKSGVSLRHKAKNFLNHPDPQTRYWAMNSIVSCFEPEVAKEI